MTIAVQCFAALRTTTTCILYFANFLFFFWFDIEPVQCTTKFMNMIKVNRSHMDLLMQNSSNRLFFSHSFAILFKYLIKKNCYLFDNAFAFFGMMTTLMRVVLTYSTLNHFPNIPTYNPV